MKLLRWVNPLVSGKRFVIFALVVLVALSAMSAVFQDASAARLTQRSLKMEKTASLGRYALSFSINTANDVGSIKIDTTSTPLNMTEAVVVSQSGEGFNVNFGSTVNTFIMSRNPVAAGNQVNNYIIEGIRNSSATTSFSVTVTVYSGKDASGTLLQTIPTTISQVANTYTISFAFPGTASVGAIRMEFCTDPIPYLSCTSVPGLDVVGAVLSSQTGETGFTINYQTNNDIMLSRPAVNTGTQLNTYVLDNIQNPTQEGAFYVRLTSYASSNPDPVLDRENYIDYGGVVGATTFNVGLQTQVAPELIFCVSLDIPQYNCGSVSGGNFVDLGELEPDQTYATQSQFMARTNAAAGYSISMYGAGVTSGDKSIPSLTVPTLSAAGNSQFGINLTTNGSPSVGGNQDGPGSAALINPDYEIADHFVFRNGDTLVNTSGSSDFRRYTVSYLLNRSPTQEPGIYAVTVTYICTGNF